MKKLCIVILLSMLLSACGAGATPVSPQAPAKTQPAATPPGNVTLKIALIPVIDALPMYVAQKEGLFEKNGVTVEFVPVASAPERDQLIVAGQADGMVNEILSTALYNKEKVQVQTVRFARAATKDAALFSILASSKSGISDAQGLKGVPIGISQGTIIEYLTDRLLQAEGLSDSDIQTVAVPKIPDRINLLNSGELKAAMLPEPATSLAISQGAKLILNDSAHPEYSFSVITFRKAAIDANPEAISSFLKAIEEAVGLINAEPAKWGSLLVDQKVVPPPLADKFKVPTFVTAGVPSTQQWDDMLAWAKEKGLLSTDVPYAESVTGEYLP
jgi:NitT/TauT family transport system substrate-binding protein